MAATCMAVCKGSRKKIRGIFISSCHLPAAVECDIVILSEPGPNPTGPSWAVLQTQLIPARGRKRQGHRVLIIAHRGDTTYPREGTETGHIAICAKLYLDTTYPREGTETPPKCNKCFRLQTQLIPARGRVGDCGHRPLLRCNHKNMMFCIVVRCPLREYNQGRAQGRRRCLLISEIL